MKVMSLNVAIWTRNLKKSDPNYWLQRAKVMKNAITDVDPDIICFQEMWFPMNLFVPKGYRKVGGTGCEHPIYAKKDIKVEGTIFRITWSAISIKGLDIYNVHSRWEKKIIKETCDEIKDVFITRNKPLIVCGDFNNNWDVVKNYFPMLSNAREELGIKPEDTFEHFTKPDKSHGEIDLFLYDGFTPTSYEVWPNIFATLKFSDHHPVMLTF